MKAAKYALKACITLLVSSITGLLFGLLPCSLLPSFGDIRWCGFKSEPPYFFTQVTVGFTLSLVILGYWFFVRKRP